MSAVLKSNDRGNNDKKIEYLKKLSQISEVHTRKNLMRDLPKLERMLCGLTMELCSAIQSLSGLDPRRFGAKKKYEDLCASTKMACDFFRSFVREKPYQGYIISSQDVEDALLAWINELNGFSKIEKAEGKPVWLAMKGKQIKLTKLLDQQGSRFQAVDEFSIETENAPAL